MADIIRLTAGEVEAVASQFSQAASETQALVNNLSRQVDGMASGWEGDAYNAFVVNFQEISNQMASIVTMYEGLNNQLRQVVSTMQEADSSIASALRG